MKITLRLSGRQHEELRQHLFQDENEAAAIIVCGRRERKGAPIFTAHKIVPVPFHACKVRTPLSLHWEPEAIVPALKEALRNNWSVVKIHSHPRGFPEFSLADDAADRDLFPSLYGWVDVPHASAVMLPGGKIFGRYVDHCGKFTPIERISVAGDDLYFWDAEESGTAIPATADRHAKAFGAATTRKLGTLTGILGGCSGTGSIIGEQLGRLQFKKLFLVDPERCEDLNLNRVFGMTAEDVRLKRFKVDVLKRSIDAMGLGIEVVALSHNIFDARVIRLAAESDLVFGGMDSALGRHILNKIASTYNIPYFDAGVKLTADGFGAIQHVCGTVHYLQPGGSSLLSRSVYTMEEFEDELLLLTDPTCYAERLKEKYITGVVESRPAVVSVNTIISGLCVTEMLARLHPFRDDPNGKFASFCLSLNHGIVDLSPDGEPCPVINRYVGRGDMVPLLGLQGLEERAE